MRRYRTSSKRDLSPKLRFCGLEMNSAKCWRSSLLPCCQSSHGSGSGVIILPMLDASYRAPKLSRPLSESRSLPVQFSAGSSILRTLSSGLSRQSPHESTETNAALRACMFGQGILFSRSRMPSVKLRPGAGLPRRNLTRHREDSNSRAKQNDGPKSVRHSEPNRTTLAQPF